MTAASGVGKIHVLPADVASRIAAGEVVERPAAVVKELIDNSLDAHSTSITIEVTHAGLSLIRVSDDGEGMSPADAGLAFQRHATSKIRSERDLESVRTLGFRGEALPSIASVSKVQLLTARRTEPAGVRVKLTGGNLDECEEAAVAPGTQVEVAELFFNTPARKKFLKSPATEYSHICQVVQHAALAWPDRHFRLKHNGQELLNYPSVATRRERLLQVYGKRHADQFIQVQGKRPGFNLEGYTVRPLHARGVRAPQELFVNNRAIKNPTVSHAVYDAYGSFLAKGRHPVFVLFVDLDPGRVDVNVHPTKREVRFADQELVHRSVRGAIHEAIETDSSVAGLERRSAETQGSAQDSSMRRVVLNGGPAPPTLAQDQAPMSFAGGTSGLLSGATGTPSGLWPRELLAAEGGPAYVSKVARDVTPLGQISRTFLVAQVGSELQVIDQHTAHERVLFEQLLRGCHRQSVASQPLLIPETVDLSPSGLSLIERHAADLERLGLTVEPFGSNTCVIRAVPALLGKVDYAALVQDLLEDVAAWNTTSSLDARLRPVMASLACHGAVRAGRAMELPEVKRLIEDWVNEGLPPTCPHGRRIALRLPAEELSRIFGRA